jgi:hypothetical protein
VTGSGCPRTATKNRGHPTRDREVCVQTLGVGCGVVGLSREMKVSCLEHRGVDQPQPQRHSDEREDHQSVLAAQDGDMTVRCRNPTQLHPPRRPHQLPSAWSSRTAGIGASVRSPKETHWHRRSERNRECRRLLSRGIGVSPAPRHAVRRLLTATLVRANFALARAIASRLKNTHHRDGDVP